MPFVHEEHQVPDLVCIEDPTLGRVYVTPNGDKYPSITNVLSILSKRDIQNWQKRVGLKEANTITRRGANRGTALHTLVEKYLKNEPFEETIGFKIVKKDLNRIGTIYAQEVALWSDELRVAGRTDCIAEYDGVIAVVDFKTAAKVKPKAWIEAYFLQAAFYATAWEERTGIPIEKIVIIFSNDDGTSVVYEESKSKWMDTLRTVIDMYYNDVR